MHSFFFALAASVATAYVTDPLDETPLPSLSACGGWGPEPCAFGDNAVLASSTPWSAGATPARLFGSANANEKLTLSGLPPGAVVTPASPFSAGADGRWEVTVASPDSPAKFDLTVSGSSGKAVTLHGLRFGHTILCSGVRPAPPPPHTHTLHAPRPQFVLSFSTHAQPPSCLTTSF